MVAAQWSPSDSTSVSTGSSLVLIIFGLAAGLLASVVMLLGDRKTSILRLPCFALILFAGWLAIATFYSHEHTNFRASLLGFWQTLALIGVFQGLVSLFSSGLIHNRVLHWSIALSFGTSSYALYQYFVSMPQTRARFGEFKEEMLGEVGLTIGTPEAMQFENRLFSTEPIGPFALTNSLAGTLAPIVVVVGIVLASLLWVDSRRLLLGSENSSAKPRVERGQVSTRRGWLAIGILIFAVSGLVLLLTKSRTAWLAVAIGLIAGGLILVKITACLTPRVIAMGIASTIGLGGLTLIVVAWLDSAIIFEAGKSLLYRLEYWQGAWQLALRSPWVGYGPLAFQSEYTTVKSMMASENPADPHNMWLEILVSGGFPLLGVAIAGAIGIAVTQLAHFFLIPEQPEQSSVESDCETSQHDSLAIKPVANKESRLIMLDAGAIVVLVLILFFGLIVYSVNNKSDLPFNALAFCLGASGCYWLIRSVRLSDAGLWMASVLMLLVVSIHFLFSGGWMQPGAMSPFAVGLAGLYHVRGKCNQVGVSGVAEKRSWVAFVLFAGWFVAAILFGVLTLQPETIRGPIEQLHLENRLTDLPMEEYSKVLESSGWDPEPASWIMRGAYQRLTDKNLGQATRWKWLEVYKLAKRKWIANDPRNWLVASQISIMDASVLVACRSAGYDPTGFLEMNDIIAEANRATKLNPSSAQCHLQKAVILYWALESEGAKVSLDLAEKVDQATPHADRKLNVCTVWVPDDLVKREAQSLQAFQAVGMPGFFKGEPVFSWLRKVIP